MTDYFEIAQSIVEEEVIHSQAQDRVAKEYGRELIQEAMAFAYDRLSTEKFKTLIRDRVDRFEKERRRELGKERGIDMERPLNTKYLGIGS